MRVSLFLFLISFISFSCDSTDNQTTVPPTEAETLLNVSYGSHPQQTYDLYLPAERSKDKTKVVLLIHGGGWIEGDKEDMNGIVTLIQNTHPEHAIVNINYVLATSQQAAFPNQFINVEEVVAKLTDQANDLQIKPEFGFVGVSAGAHISLMYDYVYDTQDKVKFVVDIVGPTDFTNPFYTNNPNFDLYLASLVDETAYPLNTNFAEVLSPLYQVSESSSPTLLFYGNEDELVPLENGEDLKNQLLEFSIPNNFTVYNGGHGNWNTESYLDVQQKIADYIDLYLPID